MHLILTGATGLVGSGVLDAMIKSKAITKISILSRRPVPMAVDAKDDRIQVIQHQDFSKYGPELMSQLADASGCVWALGVSTTQVSDPTEYTKITKEYAFAAAEAFGQLTKAGDNPFRFVYVSGEGATHSPGHFTQLFARVKGETELRLADMAQANTKMDVFLARPAMVDGSRHEAVQAYLPRRGFAYNAMQATISPLARSFFKNYHSPTDQLGQCLVQLAIGELDAKLEGFGVEKLQGSWLVSNVGIRRLMAP